MAVMEHLRFLSKICLILTEPLLRDNEAATRTAILGIVGGQYKSSSTVNFLSNRDAQNNKAA
jgi:hypothetical protein